MCVALSCATNIVAGTYTPDNLPIPYLQDKTKYVSNPDGLLSSETVDSLNFWLGEMETEHGVQTVLAVVERIQGGDTYEFCMALGRKHGIGSKEKNTGLIILLATEDRAYTILTGRGLEGTLPDAICKRIENRQMLPSLREGDWDEAMLNTVRAITAYVDGDPSLVGNADFDDDDDDLAALMVFILMMTCGVGLILFAVWLENRKKSYCPSCHQYKMKKVSGYVTKNRILGIRTHHDTYRCSHCFFTKELHWDEDINGSGGAAAAGGALGGSFFGRGGGSSSFGGSFGGGSFGGGGASGRF